MRVISGIYRGRKLASPLNNAVRPTTDKVKEAVFAILQNDLPNATVIDLFSGTGAIGVEAVSRGAKKVYMCDNTPASLDVIKQNLSFVDKTKYDLFKGDYTDCLRRIASKGEQADVIFVDPPYYKGIPSKALATIERLNVLKKDGIVIVERKESDTVDTQRFALLFTRKYGETCIDVYRNYTKGAFTGTFDPFTLGHRYVAEKALEEVDFLHVVILVNEEKKAKYSIDNRIDMIKASLPEYKKRIKVEFFDGLAIDYCNKNGIKCIYRGVRDDKDAVYEKEMAEWNKSHGDVDTVLIKAENTVSSTMVKRLLEENQDVDQYVYQDAVRFLTRR